MIMYALYTILLYNKTKETLGIIYVYIRIPNWPKQYVEQNHPNALKSQKIIFKTLNKSSKQETQPKNHHGHLNPRQSSSININKYILR